MRRTADPAPSLKSLMACAALALSGCTDTAGLCEARLTPINLPVTASAPPQSKASHP